ncbi:hypothetical protein HDU97_003299 [Phlyctochytrium planicorne]|nr:hypothetical protein HDU97_003299 [Phlyctochytrium planicorne]
MSYAPPNIGGHSQQGYTPLVDSSQGGGIYSQPVHHQHPHQQQQQHPIYGQHQHQQPPPPPQQQQQQHQQSYSYSPYSAQLSSQSHRDPYQTQHDHAYSNHHQVYDQGGYSSHAASPSVAARYPGGPIYQGVSQSSSLAPSSPMLQQQQQQQHALQPQATATQVAQGQMSLHSPLNSMGQPAFSIDTSLMGAGSGFHSQMASPSVPMPYASQQQQHQQASMQQQPKQYQLQSPVVPSPVVQTPYYTPSYPPPQSPHATHYADGSHYSAPKEDRMIYQSTAPSMPLPNPLVLKTLPPSLSNPSPQPMSPSQPSAYSQQHSASHSMPHSPLQIISQPAPPHVTQQHHLENGEQTSSPLVQQPYLQNAPQPSSLAQHHEQLQTRPSSAPSAPKPPSPSQASAEDSTPLPNHPDRDAVVEDSDFQGTSSTTVDTSEDIPSKSEGKKLEDKLQFINLQYKPGEDSDEAQIFIEGELMPLKKKRKRRTKAEMIAARKEAEEKRAAELATVIAWNSNIPENSNEHLEATPARQRKKRTLKGDTHIADLSEQQSTSEDGLPKVGSPSVPKMFSKKKEWDSRGTTFTSYTFIPPPKDASPPVESPPPNAQAVTPAGKGDEGGRRTAWSPPAEDTAAKNGQTYVYTANRLPGIGYFHIEKSSGRMTEDDVGKAIGEAEKVVGGPHATVSDDSMDVEAPAEFSNSAFILYEASDLDQPKPARTKEKPKPGATPYYVESPNRALSPSAPTHSRPIETVLFFPPVGAKDEGSVGAKDEGPSSSSPKPVQEEDSKQTRSSSSKSGKISNNLLLARAIFKWQDEHKSFGDDAAVKEFGGLPSTEALIRAGLIKVDTETGGYVPGSKYGSGGEGRAEVHREERAVAEPEVVPNQPDEPMHEDEASDSDALDSDPVIRDHEHDNPLMHLADIAAEAVSRSSEAADAAPEAGTNSAEELVLFGPPVKPKRKRRTRREMEHARAVAAATKAGLPPPPPLEDLPQKVKRSRRKKNEIIDSTVVSTPVVSVREELAEKEKASVANSSVPSTPPGDEAPPQFLDATKLFDQLMANARKVTIGEDRDMNVLAISRPLPDLTIVRDRYALKIEDADVSAKHEPGTMAALPDILRRRRLRMSEALDLLMVVDFLNAFGEEFVRVKLVSGVWSLGKYALERLIYNLPKTYPRLLALYYVLLAAANSGWKGESLAFPPRLEETHALVYTHLSNVLDAAAKVNEDKSVPLEGDHASAHAPASTSAPDPAHASAPVPVPAPAPSAPTPTTDDDADSDYFEFPPDDVSADGSKTVKSPGTIEVDKVEDAELRVAKEAFGRINDVTLIPPHIHAKVLWCLARDAMGTEAFGEVMDASMEELEASKRERYLCTRKQTDLKADIKAVDGEIEAIDSQISALEEVDGDVRNEGDEENTVASPEGTTARAASVESGGSASTSKRPKRQEVREQEKAKKQQKKERKAEILKLAKDRKKLEEKMVGLKREVDVLELEEERIKADLKVKMLRLRSSSRRYLGMDRDLANYLLVDISPSPAGASSDVVNGDVPSAGDAAEGGDDDIVIGDEHVEDGHERTIQRNGDYHDNAVHGHFRPEGWGKDGPVFGVILELPKEHENPLWIPTQHDPDNILTTRDCFTQPGPTLPKHRAIDSIQALKRLYECLNDRGTRERDLASGLRNFFRTCGVGLSATQWLHKRTAAAAADALAKSGAHVDMDLFESGLFTCHEILLIPEAAKIAFAHSSAFKAVYPGTGSHLGPHELALSKSLGWFGDWVASLGKALPEIQGNRGWDEVLEWIEQNGRLMEEEEEEMALAMDGSMGVAFDEDKDLMEISLEDIGGNRGSTNNSGSVSEEESGRETPPMGFATPKPYPLVLASFARRHLVELMAALDDERAPDSATIQKDLLAGLTDAMKSRIVMPNAVVDEEKEEGMVVSAGALAEPKPAPRRKGRPPKGGWGPKDDGRGKGKKTVKPPPLLSISMVGVKLSKPKDGEEESELKAPEPYVVDGLTAAFYKMTVHAFLTCERQEDAVELAFRLAVAYRKGGWSALCVIADSATQELKDANRKEQEEMEDPKPVVSTSTRGRGRGRGRGRVGRPPNPGAGRGATKSTSASDSKPVVPATAAAGDLEQEEAEDESVDAMEDVEDEEDVDELEGSVSTPPSSTGSTSSLRKRQDPRAVTIPEVSDLKRGSRRSSGRAKSSDKGSERAGPVVSGRQERALRRSSGGRNTGGKKSTRIELRDSSPPDEPSDDGSAYISEDDEVTPRKRKFRIEDDSDREDGDHGNGNGRDDDEEVDELDGDDEGGPIKRTSHKSSGRKTRSMGRKK